MAGEPILIVEDNQVNLMLVKALLTFKNYDLRTAANAEEALKVLAAFQPQLIIMDIQLPGMDGLELTRKLKADPKYHDIIIIAVTAYAMKGDKEKCIKAGATNYLSKPIDIEQLLSMLSEHLPLVVSP